jgi:hypothetical protein
MQNPLLKQAEFNHDMEKSDGTWEASFVLETGVPEVPDWVVTLQQPKKDFGAPVRMTIRDSYGSHSDIYPTINNANTFLVHAAHLLRDDILQYPKYKSRIEVLMVRIFSQINWFFEHIQ